ncbi:MAG TPA: VOC family protein [Candidatus Binatia bacterium]|nr:VOC family protein [Candidatus Binatia bacterium]
MIDHISLGVSDFKRSQAFYKAVLKPLGFKLRMTFGEASGYGVDDHPTFWIGTPEYSGPIQGAGTHVAFVAPDRKSVDAFYKAAVKHGATDNGKPGLRPQYHENYYGAFVLDLDGHRIEACCHLPVAKKAAAKKKAAKAKSKSKSRR